MNHKNKSILGPEYVKQFRCIGSSCQDNCCIGWDVDIDKKTYYKYQKFKEEDLMRLFKSSVHQNREAYSDEVDFAKVKLKKDKRCPFLNDENLCIIQAKVGENYLSNVCATYPRFTNLVDDVYEQSATVSCPEAARLILKNKLGLSFASETADLGLQTIIMYEVDTRISGQNSMINHLLALRQFSISVLQNRDYTLADRLLILGYFYSDLQKLTDRKRALDIPGLIKAHNEKIRDEKFREEIKGLPVRISDQMKIVSEIASQLHVYDEIDSKRFIAFNEDCKNGISGAKQHGVRSEHVKNYSDSYRMNYEPFMAKHGYVLENYLVNYVFSSLFPAGESQKPFEAYSLLVARYALIKYYLVGIAASKRGLNEKLAIEFIQVFSKAVEHHKTFLESIPSYLQRKKQNTLNDMSILLKH